jgi:hypothetical protein
MKISAATGRFAVGDMNTMLNTFNHNAAFERIRKSDPPSPWYEVRGNILPVHHSLFGWEAELMLNFSRRMSLGFSACGPELSKKNDSALHFLKFYGDEIWPHYYRYKPEIKARAPFKVNVYFFPETRWRIFFAAGIGYYRGMMSHLYNFSEINGTNPERNGWLMRYWETEWKGGFGIQTKVGIEYPILKWLSLSAELEMRYAKIKNFRANQIYKAEDREGTEIILSINEETSGWLYYFTHENLFIFGERHADLQVWEVPPPVSIDMIADIRKAKLDLSGLALVIGFKFSLF